jgi:cytochrome oxidase Cu insertion factor (SCO1/SenC/PrrC family)
LLLILLASFIIPFVIGDLAYRLGWYEGGQVNKGRLLNPPASFAEFQARSLAGVKLDGEFAKSSWWLLYVMPAECEASCRNRLFQMRQVRKALGKEAERLSQLLVFTGPVSAEIDALLKEDFAGFVRIEAEAASVDIALQRAATRASGAGQLYIMDPMGWIMLSYAPVVDEKASVVRAEEILQDLKKLLKGSRIG